MIVSVKQIRTATYLLFVIVFITYMLSADRIYNALSGKSYAVKLPDNISLYAKGNLEIIAVSDYAPVNNKYEEGKGLRGQFVRVANKSGNAKIRVFLRSSNALYEVVENRRSFWAHAVKIAANFFASTSGLENGIYQIGLSLSDDEGERLVWMDSFFEKAAGGPMEYVARPIAPIPARISEDLKFAIERIEKDNKEFLFQGWTALDNREMNDCNAYIIIKNSGGISKTFYAALYTRMDIASMYNDPRAANSGFRIKVPQNEFVLENHVIKVAIKSRATGEAVESVQTETRNF